MQVSSPSPIKNQAAWAEKVKALHKKGKELEAKIARRKEDQTLLQKLSARLVELRGQIERLSEGLRKAVADLEAEKKQVEHDYEKQRKKKEHQEVKAAQERAKQETEKLLAQDGVSWLSRTKKFYQSFRG
ncbi:hypothetical protein EBX93_15180 [bacterium]|nr:hypothetical protein [bacterium]